MKEYQQREPQISEREIERKYSKLDIKAADPNRINCYTCSRCKYTMKTIDVHYGVTPMFLRCDCCGGRSQSTWYSDVIPDKKPEYEWRVPTLSELKKYKRNPAMLDHIFNGGLELFTIK